MTPTLKVDTAQLAAAGQAFQAASDAVPAAPAFYIPTGSDALTAAAAANAPKFADPVTTGLPKLKTETAAYAANIKDAASTYATTDQQAAADVLKQKLDDPAGQGSGSDGGVPGVGGGGGSAAGGADSAKAGATSAAAAGAPGAGGDPMSQLSQLGQIGGQMLQMPMQLGQMAGAIPQTAMQMAQQVGQQIGQIAGKKGESDKDKPEDADKKSAEDKKADNEKKSADDKDKSQAQSEKAQPKAPIDGKHAATPIHGSGTAPAPPSSAPRHAAPTRPNVEEQL